MLDYAFHEPRCNADTGASIGAYRMGAAGFENGAVCSGFCGEWRGFPTSCVGVKESEK